ncbi:MAG: hypothetical protein QNJ78_11415 [Gammaproteobacteria bacterium]|nr:hypothetical protein [Gammaproteobacteria bacterium]
MNDNTSQHDLLLFGTTLHGAERMDAIHKLAKLLKTSSERVELMLEKQSVVLLKRVSSEVARKYEERLISLGFKCNTRPSHDAGIELELVPKEKSLNALSCPACGHEHKYKEGASAPQQCEACDIVFEKYKQNLKLEREKIKQSLLAKSEREQKADEQERERRKEEERIRQVEEELRKELGLPRFATRRGSLISSAAGVFTLGLLLGIGGVVAYDSLNQAEDPQLGQSQDVPFGASEAEILGGMEPFDPDLISAAAKPDVQGISSLPPETLAKIDPGMLTHMQVSEKLNLPSESSDTRLSETPIGVESSPSISLTDDQQPLLPNDLLGKSRQVRVKPQTSMVGATGPSNDEHGGQSVVTSESFDASALTREIYDRLGTDPEWDDYLVRQVRAAFARGQTMAGLKILSLLGDRQRMIAEGAKLAVLLNSTGKAADSDTVFKVLLQTIETQPGDDRAKIQAFHSIARHQAAIPGNALVAEATAMKARVIAQASRAACDRAATSAEVAAMMRNLGHHKAAKEAYQRSSEGFNDIQDQQELLVCLGYLVGSYHRAGNRGSATMLLQDMTKAAKALDSREGRDAVLHQVSRLYRELGDIQSAQNLAGDIEDPFLRDATRYLNVLEEASTGRIESAMQGLKSLQSKFFKARAYAILGLSQERDDVYRQLAGQSFTQAQKLGSALTSPLEQMIVYAELGRYLNHAGMEAEAHSGFGSAAHQLDLLPQAKGLDRPLAILAVNQARASRLSGAREHLAKIGDGSVAQVAREFIAESEQLLREAKH